MLLKKADSVFHERRSYFTIPWMNALAWASDVAIGRGWDKEAGRLRRCRGFAGRAMLTYQAPRGQGKCHEIMSYSQ